MIQEGDILKLLEKDLEGKWPTIYVNKKQHLPYWQFVNNKSKVLIVTQPGSILLPIHHEICLYLNHINYYSN